MLRTTLRSIPKHHYYNNNKVLASSRKLVYPTVNLLTVKRLQSSLTAETSYEEETQQEQQPSAHVNTKTPVNTTPLNGK